MVRFLSITGASLLGLLLLASPARAERDLVFEVVVENAGSRLILRAVIKGEDKEDADTVWKKYSTVELGSDAAKVKADPGKENQATLKGKIGVWANHGGYIEVKQLRLVRKDKDSKWMVAPEEIEKTLKTRKKP